MPLTREQSARYPKNWKAFSLSIRMDRAAGRCECTGECGLHRDNPGPRRCIEVHGHAAKWAKGKVILTVAHLDAKDGPCKCPDPCVKPEHVKAMCQRCHLRYDLPRHQANSAATRRAKRDLNQVPLGIHQRDENFDD